jgi:predicted PurR-regulated permease PerM
MSNNLKALLKKTRNKAKHLRDKVNKLKKEQQSKQTEAEKELASLKKPERKKTEHIIVEFSMVSVAKAAFVVIILYILTQFFFQIKEVLILVFIALFLAAALDSIVDRMEKKKIPRAVSILGIYAAFLVVIGIFISTLIPLLANQTLELAKTVSDLIANLTQSEELWNLPYTENARAMLEDFLDSADQDLIAQNIQGALEQVGNQLQNIAGNTWGAIKIVFNGLFNALLVLVLTFFMVVDERGIDRFFISLFPSKHTKYIIAKMEAVKEKIGYWLRGQLNLMIAMTAITFIPLSILGVDYALTLAFLAGMTELLPVIGPIIAMVPALLIGLNDSPGMALTILILYIIIQQLEGNILVPLIMKKAVGLSPIIVVIVMLIGFQFLGIMGVIISVPVATAISIFIKDYAEKAK